MAQVQPLWARVPDAWIVAGNRRLSRDVLAAGLLCLVSWLWFVANHDHPRGPLILLWISAPVSVLIPIRLCRHIMNHPDLLPPTRAFWRRIGISAGFVGVGCLSEINDVLGGPSSPSQLLGPVTLTIDCVAVAVLMWAMYRMPLSGSTPGERLRAGLDAGAVMLAAAIFIWHFQTRALLMGGAGDSASALGGLIVIVLALVAVFGVAKIVLSSYAFIDRAALRLLAVALVVSCLGSLPECLTAGRPYLMLAQVMMPTIMLFVTWSADYQLNAPKRVVDLAAALTRRRQYSVWPYLAVAAVDGLLVVSVWPSNSEDRRPVTLAAVVLTGIVLVRQITAFQDNGRLLARLDHGATHDALTQLPNRMLFHRRLDEALMAPAGRRPISAALIDLDDFKMVNDTLGHGVGDALLIAVGERLRTSVRVRDTVGRLGGDEFVVLLDGVDPAGADLVVERILDALTAPVLAQGHELLIRASIGIADGSCGDDAGELLRRADMAMYAAKREGGANYLRYTPDMVGGSTDQAHLGAELRRALDDDQLVLLYQPIVALDGGALTGVEALVRWAHPTLGMLTPADFIPIAERTGLILSLGRWVLFEACRQAMAWSDEYGEVAPGICNVNVSARELREPDYPSGVAAALAHSGLAPHRLTLEVTETTVFGLGASAANLRAVHRMGVRISLDDFGTGQSSLSVLESCPIDELKLDRSFTQADPAGTRATVATAVIHLAQVLGLRVIAEGVETSDQGDRLRALGYQFAQGFYFAKPMSVAQIGDILTARQRIELAV